MIIIIYDILYDIISWRIELDWTVDLTTCFRQKITVYFEVKIVHPRSTFFSNRFRFDQIQTLYCRQEVKRERLSRF